MINMKNLELDNLKGLPHGMKLWYGNAKGEAVSEERRQLIHLMFATPDSFVRACYIQTNEGEKAKLVPTRTQLLVTEAYHNNRWIYVSKYRQAMISTISALLVLRDAMYGEAIKAAIVAQDKDTCDEIMDRIIYAYENMPEAFRNPLKKGTSATRERIEFANGNQISTITAGSKSPGVGKSRDRVLITEGCEMPEDVLGRLQTKMFPAMENRPNARVIFETTPGKAHTRLHRLWLNTWNPPPGVPARFTPIFLEWWLDDRRRLQDPETGELIELGPLTEDEEALMEKMPGCTRHHIYFRRATLPATFDNKPAAFENKYPSGPEEGWTTASEKIFDGKAVEYLGEMKDLADETPEEIGPSGLWEFVEPDPRTHYLFTVDPANFGESGDFSAVAVFDTTTWEEVASWEGRIQPTGLHKMLQVATKRYRQVGAGSGNTVIIEANAAALLGIAVNEITANPHMSYNVWYNDVSQKTPEPGWRASAKSLQEAEADMDVALIQRDITLRSKTGIRQLIFFDGKDRNRRIKKGKDTSHFDLARTYVIAAWALTRLNWPRRLTDAEYEDKLTQETIRLQNERNALLQSQEQELTRNLIKRGRRMQKQDKSPWAPGAGWV